MEIPKAEELAVQSGDLVEVFVDSSTDKTKTMPLEIMVDGEKAPFYREASILGEVFVDSSTVKTKSMPLEIMVDGEMAPFIEKL